MKSCCNCKNYEKKEKDKNNKYDIPWKAIVNAIAILVFLVFLFVEIFYLKKIEVDDSRPIRCHVKTFYDNFCFKVEDKFYVNNIISIVCPVVATVLAVSVTLYRELIYGVSFATFRKFSSRNRYTLEEMIVIPIIILALCVTLYYFSIFFTTCILNLIALAYAIYFIISELRLLGGGYRQTTNILKRVFDEYEQNLVGNEDSRLDLISFSFGQRDSDTSKKKKEKKQQDNKRRYDYYSGRRQDAKTILVSLIYEDNLKEASNRLGLTNLNSINDMLDLSTEHLNDASVLKYENPMKYQNIKERHVYNVYSYLDLIYEVEIEDDLIASTENSIFNAYEAIQANFIDEELNETYSQTIAMISRLLYPKTKYLDNQNPQNHDLCLLRVSNKLMVSSLNSCRLWYFNYLFDTFKISRLDSALVDDKYFVFATIYLFYYSCRHINDNFKNDIINLLSKKSDEINTRSPIFDTLWKYYGRGFDKYLELLDGILKYFHSPQSETTWWFISGSGRGEKFFDETYILYWWVAFLFLGGCQIPSDFASKVSTVLKSESELNVLAHIIEDYTSENKTTFDEVIQYFKYVDLGSGRKNSPDYVNEFFMPSLDSFVNEKVGEEKVDAYIEGLEVLNKEIENYKSDLEEKISTNPFFGKELKIDDGEINETDYSGIYDVTSIESFKLNFDSEIRRLLCQTYVNKYCNDETNKLDFDLVRKAIFEYGTSFTTLDFDALLDKNGNTWQFNSSSISFNMIVSDDSGCCELSDVEIDEIINKNYSQKDGLYIYNKPNSNKNIYETYYVNRDRLFMLIKKNDKHFMLHLTFVVKFDTENMFTKASNKKGNASNNPSQNNDSDENLQEAKSEASNKQDSEKTTNDAQSISNEEVDVPTEGTETSSTSKTTNKEDTSKKK